MSRQSIGTESDTIPGQPTASVLTPYGIGGARTGRQPALARCGATLSASSPAPRQSTSSGQMRAVLLDRAERQEHDRARIVGQRRRLRRRQLREADHGVIR